MSRTALSPEQKDEYMIADLPFLLEKEARKRSMCQKDLAKALKISPQAYNARKKRKRDGKPKDTFSYGEMLKLFRLLEMSGDEILKLFQK